MFSPLYHVKYFTLKHRQQDISQIMAHKSEEIKLNTVNSTQNHLLALPAELQVSIR